MLGRLLRRLTHLLRSGTAERDLHDELQLHLERLTADFVRDGLPPDEARAAALREFGGLEQSKEACRDARGLRLLHELREDLRYAGRMLRKHTGLTAVVMVTLGVGIGATTAIFAVVDAVLLRPLSFPAADRLVVIKERTAARPDRAVAFPDFLDFRARQKTFDGMSAALIIGGVLTGDAEAERVFGHAVTRDFFETLGTPMLIGRSFTADEDQPGGARAIILSYPLWQRRYGRDETVVGRAVSYNGESHTIVGVLPATFDYYGRGNRNYDIFLPIGPLRNQRYMQTRESFPVSVVGRMKPGVPLARAWTDLATISSALEQEHSSTNQGVSVTLTPLLEDFVGDTRRALIVLLAASCLVLTIACVNVANLLFARASTRRQEVAVRLALGARRGRILRQLITESLLLSAIGGAFGLCVAWLATNWLTTLAPAGLPRMDNIALDWRLVFFSALITTMTGLACGIAPAGQTADVDLHGVMRSTGRAVTGGGTRLRAALVTGQVAVCVALLIGTGLMLRSFHRLSAVDPGFRAANVVTMRLRLPDARYRTRDQVLPMLDGVLQRIAALPGVDSVCLTTGVPLGRWRDSGFTVAGQPEEPPDRGPLALTQWVTADYHRTFGIGVLAGRAFTPADGATAADVTIVDEEFVRRHMPGRRMASALGQRIRVRGDGERWRAIVGVVRHISHGGLDEIPRAEIYIPYAQAEPGWQLEVGRAMDIGVRSDAPTEAVLAAVRQQIRSFDPELPLSNITTLEAALERSMAPRLLNVVLLSVFSGAALLLCVVGISGVVSYAVSQRTREIGVRVALGAQRREVLALVMRGGMRTVLGGVALGVAAALALGRVLEGLLFSVHPRDPLTVMTVAATLTVVAALASYLPARRAMTVDVVATLRAD
jgi:putative ABC transport system permease protein